MERVNLGAHYQTFIEHKIDADILPDLTEADLEKLNIPLGDRKRLLKAIQALDKGTLKEKLSVFEGPALAPSEHVLEGGSGPDLRAAAEQLRYLTTVFVDLVGSTTLSEELDIEDYWQTITSYQVCCTDIIRKYHGFVARYLGDGVLAYFGYPRAAEDDAERAVAAGLEIVEAVERIENEKGLELEARVGIATGKVLISDVAWGRHEFEETALGDTPNLAARLQSIAQPGTVVMSEATHNLLGTHFDCEKIGDLELKGFSKPVAVWHARSVHLAASRFDARQKGPITPLTGRDEELALLLKRWQSATEGDGRVSLISGEAGIGKSRLVESLYDNIKGTPHYRVRYQCSPFHTQSALHPVINQLTHAAGVGDRDSSHDSLDKLEALLSEGVEDVQTVAPLFARLLSIPNDGRYRPLEGTPEAIRESTKSALLEQSFGLAETRPLVVVFEDIHWIDPSTEELLGALIDHVESHRMMVLCTYRPEYEAIWAGQAGVSTLHLSRLDHRQSIEMVRQLCGRQGLTPEMAEEIANRTEGVPLFIEELTGTVLEGERKQADEDEISVSNSTAALALPSTLNELLMAKLDSLSDTKDVVSICAAIGRTSTYGLVAMVSGLPDETLRATLDKLVRAQILRQRGQWPDVTYSFRHALIQEAAYSTMLKSRARSLHGTIADALVAKMPDYAERSPEVVAYHYSHAAEPKQARDFWASAGNVAIDRSDYLEAIAHLEAALRENAALEVSQDQVKTEIAIRERLVVPLEARFWGSDDIAANFNRLHELHLELGDDKHLFTVLDGLYGTHIIGGQPGLALSYATKMAEIAETLDETAYSVMSQHALAMCRFNVEQFDEAIAHFASAIRLRPRASEDVMRQLYLADVEIIDQGMQAWAYVLNGQTYLAGEAIERAKTITEATEHDFSRAYGFSILASVHQAVGDEAASLHYAARALELSRRHKFRYWEAWAQIILGWATVVTGDADQGIEELKAGLDNYIKTGSKQIVPYAKALLADAYLRDKRNQSGLLMIDEIKTDEKTIGVRFHRPLADRVAGELKAQLDG